MQDKLRILKFHHPLCRLTMKEPGDFKVSLPEPPTTLVECKTDLVNIAWVLEKLLQCHGDNTHQLLEKPSVGTLFFSLRYPLPIC